MKARPFKKRVPKPEFELIVAQLIVGPTTSPWYGAIMCFTAMSQATCIKGSLNGAYSFGQKVINLYPPTDTFYWRILTDEETKILTNGKTLSHYLSEL